MAIASIASSPDTLPGIVPSPESSPESCGPMSMATVDKLEALIVELRDMVDVTKIELETLKTVKADFPEGEE